MPNISGMKLALSRWFIGLTSFPKFPHAKTHESSPAFLTIQAYLVVSCVLLRLG